MQKQKNIRLVVLFGGIAVLIALLVAVMMLMTPVSAEEADVEPTPMPMEDNPTYVLEADTDDTDWAQMLAEAVITGDTAEGSVAEFRLVNDDPDTPLNYNDLFLLAKIMTAESGVDWPDWTIMAIGEVVLNRVASPEFPDTIEDVIMQSDPVQYEPVFSGNWERIVPTERYVELALRLLQGERVLNDESIIFQALFEQGSSTIVTYYDAALDTTTYFCRANNMEVYA